MCICVLVCALVYICVYVCAVHQHICMLVYACAYVSICVVCVSLPHCLCILKQTFVDWEGSHGLHSSIIHCKTSFLSAEDVGWRASVRDLLEVVISEEESFPCTRQEREQ